jgi:hypothetical protein
MKQNADKSVEQTLVVPEPFNEALLPQQLSAQEDDWDMRLVKFSAISALISGGLFVIITMLYSGFTGGEVSFNPLLGVMVAVFGGLMYGFIPAFLTAGWLVIRRLKVANSRTLFEMFIVAGLLTTGYSHLILQGSIETAIQFLGFDLIGGLSAVITTWYLLKKPQKNVTVPAL